jgi:cytochrome d ubiquinol oxidase subunit I
MTTLVGFIIFYSTLLVVEIYLMAKAIRIGPQIVAPSLTIIQGPIAVSVPAE